MNKNDVNSPFYSQSIKFGGAEGALVDSGTGSDGGGCRSSGLDSEVESAGSTGTGFSVSGDCDVLTSGAATATASGMDGFEPDVTGASILPSEDEDACWERPFPPVNAATKDPDFPSEANPGLLSDLAGDASFDGTVGAFVLKVGSSVLDISLPRPPKELVKAAPNFLA